MKRSPELTPLSHDHHQGLFAAQQLRRADDPATAAAQLLGFWKSHGRRHFEIEEGVLLPAWFAGDPDADAAMAARVAKDHLALRTAVRKTQDGRVELEGLRKCGELLADHVRFEERELFPRIEGALDADQLAALGREIAQAEGRTPIEESER